MKLQRVSAEQHVCTDESTGVNNQGGAESRHWQHTGLVCAGLEWDVGWAQRDTGSTETTVCIGTEAGGHRRDMFALASAKTLVALPNIFFVYRICHCKYTFTSSLLPFFLTHKTTENIFCHVWLTVFTLHTSIQGHSWHISCSHPLQGDKFCAKLCPHA